MFPGVANLREKYPESWLLEYMEEINSDNSNILIGQDLKLELDILLGYFNGATVEINAVDTNVKIDFALARKHIKFIETKCKHSEAPYAGKPFILELFQKAFIEAIYIFWVYDIERELWTCLHQEVLYLVARKCGKTPLISALGLAEFFCGEKGTKILCSSNDYAQADLAFQAIDAMRDQSSSLERVTRKNIKGIYFGNPKKPKKKGKYSYSNKGSIVKISAKTGAKEGKNIRVGMVDEGHELPDDSSVMPIRQALSTQDHPKYFELTTEGFTNDGYLDKRLKEARQVLAGDLERPRWLIWMYTQDSETEIWQDERTWIKSNPGLGKIKRWSFLRGMVEEAKTNTATRAFVLAKDFNIKQSQSQAWLLPDQVENLTTFNYDDLRGCIGLGGADLSETTDLTCAKMLVMKAGSNKKYFLTRYFIPESRVEQATKEDKQNYLEWAKQDLITICPGNENDYSLITAWFIMLVKTHNIRPFKICLDKWGANYLARELDDTGFDAEKVNFDKNNVSNPMKNLEADLRSKLVVYNNHPITRWCLGNTGLKIDSLGLIMPLKIEPTKRIDGTAAMILCYYLYNKYRTEYLQLLR